MGVFAGAGALTTADVSATVTAELITITVADGTVDYGILPINASEDTVNLVQTQVVTNAGNVDVDLEVKSSDATGGTAWNLAASAGSDAFTHRFCVTNCDSAPVWTAFNPDNNTVVTMATNIAATSGTQDFDLEIGTPSSVSDNVLKTITVTVLATAN